MKISGIIKIAIAILVVSLIAGCAGKTYTGPYDPKTEYIGLYSNSHKWIGPSDVSPNILLYYQRGAEGGVKIYNGMDFDPEGSNIWLNKHYTEDTYEGKFAMYYKHPVYGGDHPVDDAGGVSTRLLWRTLTNDEGAPFDVSKYGYFNVWVKALDGFEGFLGITLSSWDPEKGGTTGDAAKDQGTQQSFRFPQKIEGDGWICLSIPLEKFEKVNFDQFAHYSFQFDTSADGKQFLFDNLTFSVDKPIYAGDPHPDLNRKTKEGSAPLDLFGSYKLMVDPNNTFQKIDGFGFFGESSNPELHIGEMGATVVRINIPSQDPPEGETATMENTKGWEPVDDGGDMYSFIDDMSGFRKTEVDKQIAFMKEYLAINPEMKFFACTWSPPGWMKKSGKVREGFSTGKEKNTLMDDMIGEYAEFLVSFAYYLHKNGVPLYALSMANEPHFLAAFPSQILTGDKMLLVIEEVGKMLDYVEKQDPDFKRPLIAANDHVLRGHFLQDFIDLILGLAEVESAGKYVDIISYHNYGEKAQIAEDIDSSISFQFRELINTELGEGFRSWMTEASGYHNGMLDIQDGKGALSLAEAIFTNIAYAQSNAWVFFGSKELTFYDALSWQGEMIKHFARFVRPKAQRFYVMMPEAQDYVLSLGFKNSPASDNGESYTIVLINKDTLAYELDLSELPRLEGYEVYREYRSNVYHDCDDMGEINPDETYILPPETVVTLYNGPPVPFLDNATE